MLSILTCKRMLAHAFTWLKTIKNIWKSWKNYKMGVNQLLGVTHNRWPTNFFSSAFFMALTWAYRTHDGKGTFFMILECFYHFWPCERMRKHVFAGQNTQHWNFRFLFLSNISKSTIFSHHYTFLQSTIHVWTSLCSSPGTASYTFNWDKSSIITPAQWI